MALNQPVFAQESIQSDISVNREQISTTNILTISSLVVFLISLIVVFYTQNQLRKSEKSLKFEQFKNQDLKKRLKLALVTIKKMETNPDLVHSREFNLDYLRMRMGEEMFHSLIVNRMKIKVTQIITVALRPNTADKSVVGIASSSGRKIEETFDVTYELQNKDNEWKTRVLFRVSIKLSKLPTQSSSSTIAQIIECLEYYLSNDVVDQDWQPAIQGHVVKIDWDQEAKPTPLLVLEQSEEGINTSMKNNVKESV